MSKKAAEQREAALRKKLLKRIKKNPSEGTVQQQLELRHQLSTIDRLYGVVQELCSAEIAQPSMSSRDRQVGPMPVSACPVGSSIVVG